MNMIDYTQEALDIITSFNIHIRKGDSNPWLPKLRDLLMDQYRNKRLNRETLALLESKKLIKYNNSYKPTWWIE